MEPPLRRYDVSESKIFIRSDVLFNGPPHGCLLFGFAAIREDNLGVDEIYSVNRDSFGYAGLLYFSQTASIPNN